MRCRPIHEQKKEPWPASGGKQAAGDADPRSMRAPQGTGYGAQAGSLEDHSLCCLLAYFGKKRDTESAWLV